MTDEILNMRVLGEISEQLGNDTAQMLLTRYEDEAKALMTLLNSQQGKDAPVEDLIKDIHKTALGATDSVAWEYRENAVDLVKELQSEGVVVAAIEQADQSTFLQDVAIDSNKRYALVLGNEVKGVNQEIVSQADLVVEIPQLGTKHSLNVSVSAGVLLWSFFERLSLKS